MKEFAEMTKPSGNMRMQVSNNFINELQKATFTDKKTNKTWNIL